MFDINEAAPGTFDLQNLRRAQGDLSSYTNAINQYRNIGTHLMQLEAKNADMRSNITGAAIGLFRRLLELMDASALLIESGSVIPAKPLIRIMFELGCQFEYLLNEPERREEKALCIFISEFNEQFINDTKLLTIPNIENLVPREELQKQIDESMRKIDLPIFDPIRAQYDDATIKKDNRGTPTGERKNKSWFTIANPDLKKISDLIAELKRVKFQSLIYSELSRVVHSSSLMGDTLFLDKDGVPAIKPLRIIDEADACTDAILKVATYMYDLMNNLQPREKRVFFFDARKKFIEGYKDNWYAVYEAYI